MFLSLILALRFIRGRIRERELVINIDPFKNIDSCHVFYGTGVDHKMGDGKLGSKNGIWKIGAEKMGDGTMGVEKMGDWRLRLTKMEI